MTAENYVKYSEIKERLLKAEGEDDAFKEKIDNMDTPLSKENYTKLVKLILGDDYDSNEVSPGALYQILVNATADHYIDNDEMLSKITGVLPTIKTKLRSVVVTMNKEAELSFIYETVFGRKFNVYDVYEDEDEFQPVHYYEEEELPVILTDEDDRDYEYNEYNEYDEYDEVEELYESLEISYEDFRSSIDSVVSWVGIDEIDRLMDSLKEKNAITARYQSLVCILLGSKVQERFETAEEILEYFKKIDSNDLAKFVAKVKKDFENLKKDNAKKLEELEENKKSSDAPSGEVIASDEPEERTEEDNVEKKKLEAERDFFEKWCGHLDAMHTVLKKYEFNKVERGKPKVKLKYISSGIKNKFNFKNLEPKAFLDAMKNYGKYAVIGAGVGVVASIVVPSAVISGLGTIRLAYSAVKFGNKVYSKGFLNGEPTKVEKVITSVKEKIKQNEFITSVKDKIENIEINKKSIDEETEEEIIEKVKFKDTKFYKGIQKINNYLKSPAGQWFINGMAVGYKLGNWLDLNGKVKSLFENKQPTKTTVQNATSNLQTESTEPTVNETTVPQETVSQETIPQEPMPEIDVPGASTTTQTADYSWLDVGKDGDKIDLSGMKHGYTDSYAARGAYTGQYEHLNEAVNLASENATLDNGTFISEIRLPDGSKFIGNVGELLENGIDPAKCAVNICNESGSYAWGNLEEVLETLSKSGPKR